MNDCGPSRPRLRLDFVAQSFNGSRLSSPITRDQPILPSTLALLL